MTFKWDVRFESSVRKSLEQYITNDDSFTLLIGIVYKQKIDILFSAVCQWNDSDMQVMPDFNFNSNSRSETSKMLQRMQEHLIQIWSMLPGGMDVVGVACSESKKDHPDVSTFLYLVTQYMSHHPVLQPRDITAICPSILVTSSFEKPGKIDCILSEWCASSIRKKHPVDIQWDVKNSFTYLSFENFINFTFSLPTSFQDATVYSHILNELSRYAKQMNSTELFYAGKRVQNDFKINLSERNNYKGSEFSLVSMRYEDQCEVPAQEYKCSVSICGKMNCCAVSHVGNIDAGDISKNFKLDILRSIGIRMMLICDELNFASTNQEQVLSAPQRISVRHKISNNLSISFCDYVLPEEEFEDVKCRINELLGFSPANASKVTYLERLPPKRGDLDIKNVELLQVIDKKFSYNLSKKDKSFSCSSSFLLNVKKLKTWLKSAFFSPINVYLFVLMIILAMSLKRLWDTQKN